MKILIVDDEKIIRRGMMQNIPWQSLGLTPIEAHNGLEALERFTKEQPEIVLTDIRMPLMDGITLTNRIRKTNASTKILYLTGFQDIEYIQTAFRNQAVAYLLKPVLYAELVETLERTVTLCREEAGRARLTAVLERHMAQSTPFYSRRLLSDLVEGRFDKPQDLLEKLRFWGVSLREDGCYEALLVDVLEYADANAADRQAMVFGVEDVLEELLGDTDSGCAFHLRSGRFLCLVPPGQGERLRQAVPHALGEHLSLSASCCVGPPVEGLCNVYESYQAAAQPLSDEGALPERLAEIGTLSKGQLARLSEVLFWDEPAYRSEITALLATVRALPQSVDHQRGVYLLALGFLVSSAKGDTLSLEAVDAYTHCVDTLHRCETGEALHCAMAELLPPLRTLLCQAGSGAGERIVSEVRAILDQSMACNLTIQDISHQVFLTPQYLCSVFKQGTGMTINEYLTMRRIKRAKELLRGGRHKLYEIAAMVGYQDAKYFSRVFKRITGVAPSEF